jgi:parallel beta-helix repeat protein
MLVCAIPCIGHCGRNDWRGNAESDVRRSNMKTPRTSLRILVAGLWLVLSAVLGAPRTAAAQPPAGNQGWTLVDCNKEPAGALQRAIDKARLGDTIQVRGTCNENVIVPIGTDAITLDGGGNGTVNGADPAENTIQVRGPRGITIRGLTITGGRAGIDISRGASALIDGNTIAHTGRNGITLGSFSTANIVNNAIESNAAHGILVTGNAFGFIGFASADATVASPNVIRGNGTHGIYVTWSSAVRIAGNDISGNKKNGIHVDHVSQANISDNDISGNENGIFVTENSGVNLGVEGGSGLFTGPNRTTGNNLFYGIVCRVGAYVNGQRGTLNGSSNWKDFGTSCIEALNVADTF